MANGLPDVAIAQLDHVVHAMRMDGSLANLTPQQVENIVYALRVSGHLKSLRDTSAAAYNDGHLISFHNADFLAAPRFLEAYRLGKATDSWQGFEIPWRIHALCWAATLAMKLEGDFVECGVNRGGFSRAVMEYTRFRERTNRTFYLLDTFCGIPDQDLTEDNECYRNSYPDCYREVCETFRTFRNVRIIQGRVPDTLAQVAVEKVAYLAIDMNCVEPEIAAAEYFWPKLVRGAPVVLDDYGCGVWHLPQKRAFDQFAARQGLEVLTLPTGQGLLIKP